MKTRFWFGLIGGVLLLALHQGCGGVDEIPLNPFVDLGNRSDYPLDSSLDVIQLPVEALEPRTAQVGDWITIHGQGRLFPAGYARFLFSGNAETEVEIPRIAESLRVRVPSGTISGPLGFVISQQSTQFNGGGYSEATGPAPLSVRIPTPGLLIPGR